VAPPRFATSPRVTQPAAGRDAAAPEASHERRGHRFLLLLLGVNGAVMALALGAETLVPAAEAAANVGGDFIAWCSTLR
jgi:hypothetical protein